MPPRTWKAKFTGATARGHQRRFTLDLKSHASNVLTPQLEDPGNPQCCPRCISQYASMLMEPASEPALTELLDGEHTFFDSCAKVLAAPRTVDDLQPLRDLLERNALRCSTKTWHAYLQPQSPDVLSQFLSALYLFLQAPFFRGRRMLNRGSTFSKSRRGVWPLSLTDLLPYGLEASIAAHVFWWPSYLTGGAYTFLIMVLDLARPSILPILLADRNRTILMDTLLQLLTSTCAKPPRVRPRALSKLPQGLPHIAAEFFHTLLVGSDCVLGDSHGFYVGYEAALYEAISALFNDDATRAALQPHLHSILTGLAVTMHVQLSLPESALHPDFIARRARDGTLRPSVIEKELASGARMTQNLILARRRVRACARLGCSVVAAVAHPDEYAKLQACARCRLVRYCSRQCQQADWKGANDGVAHKKVCPVLCRLAEGGALEAHRPYDEYAELYNRIGITAEELRLLVAWARSSKLIDEAEISGFLSLPIGPEGLVWPRPKR
ncbi:hypothetical protein AURDEDRAFT_154053 [Auricularia subglabra TFB-10046 SS5]|nr:hypothetical protein AURDEDRAFT_154053 [Auricularia subglabra TFB-10046 SS5]